MKLVVTKEPKKISIMSKAGRISRVGNVVGIFYPSVSQKLFRSPDVSDQELVGFLEKTRLHGQLDPKQFTEQVRVDRIETNKTSLLKVYLGKPDSDKIHKLQGAYWPINETTYLGIEVVWSEAHDFTGFENENGSLDTIDFSDLPPYVHLLVEHLINKEDVGFSLKAHVLQEIEDRAFQITN